MGPVQPIVRSTPRCFSLALLTLLLLCGCTKQDQGSVQRKEPEPVATSSVVTPSRAPEPAPKTFEVTAKEVQYRAGDTDLKGYLVAPVGSEEHPGVLVVHEWWGQNAYVRMRAKKLAALGYLVLAVDMYGEGKTTESPEEAGRWAKAVNSDLQLEKRRFTAGRDLLIRDPRLKDIKIGAIGYCFGGGVVLDMVRLGVELDMVASFHGTLKTDHPAVRDSFEGNVLIEAGGADPFVPLKDVQAVKREMTAAGAEVTVDIYPGAKHAFTNPAATEVGQKNNLPIAYDKNADEKSWQQLLRVLKKTWP